MDKAVLTLRDAEGKEITGIVEGPELSELISDVAKVLECVGWSLVVFRVLAGD